MVNYSELKAASEEELQLKEQELSREVFSLASELRVTRKLEKPHLLKQKKKDRARVLTALREKRENS